MALADIKLDDKYTLDAGGVYLTGVQALTRPPMLQQPRDRQQALLAQFHQPSAEKVR